jgi:hypothetical protein
MPLKSDNAIPELKRIEQELNKLPVKAAVVAERVFLDNFKLQGFQDFWGLDGWPKRANNARPGYPTLGKSIRRGLQVLATGSVIKAVVSGEAEPYAEIHNTGGTIKIQVTDKMKKWAWAKYYEAAGALAITPGKRMGARSNFDVYGSALISMYKGMALKKVGETITIHIPKRQYAGNGLVNQKLQELFESIVSHAAA